MWGLLLTPIVYARAFVYPFVSTKGLFLQFLVELLLPFYVCLIWTKSQYRPDLKNPLTVAILVYASVALVSALAGNNWQQSFWGWPARMTGVLFTIHLILIYFYVLLLSELDGNFLDRFIKTIVWIASVVAGYGIWEWIGLPKLFTESLFPRISSFMGNPVFLASFLIIPIFLTGFVIYNEERKNWRGIFGLLLLIQLAGLYLSRTRGAYLGLLAGGVVAIAVYLLFASNKKVRTYGLAIFFILIIMSGVFAKVTKFKFSDNDSKARLIQWQMGLKGFKDQPVLGDRT
jgi:hypothetical protein